jgi:Zn ribbon nucleic-acid-binding protein
MRGITPEALDGCTECGHNSLRCTEWQQQNTTFDSDDGTIDHKNVDGLGMILITFAECRHCGHILVEDGEVVDDRVDAESQTF